MLGAESLLRTLVANGVELCLANPGTSEMQFVAALDRVPGLRGVLCLFEGVCSGAADGYARMIDLDRPELDWVDLAAGLGVPGSRAATAGEFRTQFRAALASGAPCLIEAVLAG